MNETPERGRTSRAASRAPSRAPSRAASRAPSRATSISRVNTTHSTTLSRSQSLIRKQTAPISLRPSDILIERFTAWKTILKQLILYFQGLSSIHLSTSHSLIKLIGVIQLPFRSSTQFLSDERSLQGMFYRVREETLRSVGEEHAGFARTIEGSIVRHLEKLRGEVKMHVRNIQNDTGKLANTVSKERELSSSMISGLATAISMYKNTPLALGTNPRQDPFVVNGNVKRQLRVQVNAENLLQKSIVITQANSAVFEEGIVSAIQGAWGTYEDWRLRMAGNVERLLGGVGRAFEGLDPVREWVSFSARTEHLLDPETPLRDPRNIRYPNREEPCVVCVHEGVLSRKRRYLRRWREARYVLTPAGFLHEFADGADDAMAEGAGEAGDPVFSLFLPECTLGPPSVNDKPGSGGGGSYKFHIENTKDGSGTTKGGTSISSVRRRISLGGKGGGKGGGGGDHAWSFKARSKEEMMEWWNDIRMLCARYLVASEQIERSGPVEAAVRAVGYPSEDEFQDGDEDEFQDGGETASASGTDEGQAGVADDDTDEDVLPGGTPYRSVTVGGGTLENHEKHDTREEDVTSGSGSGSEDDEDEEEEDLPTYSRLHGDKVMPGGIGGVGEVEVGDNGFPIDKKSIRSKQSTGKDKHDEPGDGGYEGKEGVNVSRKPSASSSKMSKRSEVSGKFKKSEKRESVGGGGGKVGVGNGNGNGGSRFMERLD